ncbi:hypothetical protein [Sphingobacterium sp. SGR-19]|uniref:hypothetical protein n=1 Tax=Sphingobacterium sp. SGR-19 TaxID=2710886 RepID=UPI0013EA0836|nr:hypothetical protein [Sphingobacterium sp. SGR-19]NGM66930.1 hypothetical protein [Sphingobacterium sp. SGR-19]
MKYFILCAIALVSCMGSGNRKGDETSYCFIRTDGTDQQDTTTVRFTIGADKLEGEMNWIPKEKDSRKGVLVGTIAGDEITAIWRYMQEGMEDSIEVAFKFSPNQLAQKPLKVNTNTGVQETDDDADYTLIYTPVGCDD